MEGLLVDETPADLRRGIDLLGMPAFVIDVAPDGGFRLAAINARHEELTGMNHEQVAGRRLEEVLDAETARQVSGNYQRCIRERCAIEYQEALDFPAGRSYWRTTLMPFLDSAGQVYRILGTAYEVSDQVHLEFESRFQSTLLRAWLEESPDGILVVDSEHRMHLWNQPFLELWKIPEHIMERGEGDAALEAVREQLAEPDVFVEEVLSLYSRPDEQEQGTRIALRDGRLLERYSRGLRDQKGGYWGRIWFYRDITERERMIEELTRLSRTDVLTDTANRRAFMEELEKEYDRARRHGHPMSVVMIDLDHFKAINDRHGHAAGDAALRTFAAVVRPLLRSTDVFARTGGEEFALLLPETGLAEACSLAERLRDAVAEATVENGESIFGITASFGVAELSSVDATAYSILNRADRALYEAKRSGRNRIEASA